MHIHIVETGASPEALKVQFGPYASMFKRLLQPLAPELSFSVSRPYKGETAPRPSTFDALLITGSPAGVYEGHPWIASLEELIQQTAAIAKPQIGICFGHQLMAQAFGGTVEKSSKGWGVGLHDYNVSTQTSWMTPAPSQIRCAVSHQDQVIKTPPGAKVIAGSSFCENGILEYNQAKAISFQPHPEFDHDFLEALLRYRKDRIPQAVAEQGLTSLRTTSDRQLIARWIITFLNTA